DVVLAVSRDLRAKVVELGVSPGKVRVWYRGVDTALFAPGDKAAARRRLQLPVDGNVLVWVGRLVPVKGLDILLEACARLRDRGVPFRLYLVGAGPQRQALEAASAALGLT